MNLASTLLILQLAASSPSASTGIELLQQCRAVLATMDQPNSAQPNFIDVGSCLGRIQGISDLNMLYEMRDKNSALFCLPKAGTTGQMVRVVDKYLEDRPQDLHRDASLLIVSAFMAAYPCGAER